MPWTEEEPMEKKETFVALALSGKFYIRDLCQQYGISRKTAHKYVKRYKAEGKLGLQERSRCPLGCAHASSAEVIGWVLKERRKHPTWGPKKIRERLIDEHQMEKPPACSTIGSLLNRHGLSKKAKRKPGVYRIRPDHLTEPQAVNEVWTVDFKGWFTLGNGKRCDPLTVCDRFSRFVICCKALENQQFEGTLRCFKAMMRYHGCPRIIRVDNGTPFASMALGGLSRLSVWWIEQGIEVEFMTPASPQENGSHERMHRDLKAEATKPASANVMAQQKRFDRWREEYNHLRPHESLDMRKPADLFHASQRRLGETDKMEYPASYQIKKINPTGHMRHKGQIYYVGDIFAGCRMGVFENKEGITELHYANLHLGNLSFGVDGFFKPTAFISRPNQKHSTKLTKKNSSCVTDVPG